jgi:hypothetical protein
MFYNEYICSSDERIDLIVNKHYGNLDNLNDVVSSNPDLFKLPMNLERGTIIKLPIYNTSESTEIVTNDERVALW